MEDDTPSRPAQSDPPERPRQTDIRPGKAEEPEPEGGDSACWAHLLDEDGRLP